MSERGGLTLSARSIGADQIVSPAAWQPDLGTGRVRALPSCVTSPNPSELSILAIQAPPPTRDNPLTRSVAGMLGMGFLAVMILACLVTLPWTLGRGETGEPRYNAGVSAAGRLSPSWIAPDPDEVLRLNALVPQAMVETIAADLGVSVDDVRLATEGPALERMKPHWPRYFLGTDVLGRSLGVRVLTGGGISLTIGIAAALISVVIGTAYGTVSAYAGGKVDAVMMRIVDVLFGLPYILLVVLLAVAVDAAMERVVVSRVEQSAARRAAWVEHEIQSRWPPISEERTEELVAESIRRFGDAPDAANQREQWIREQAQAEAPGPTLEERGEIEALAVARFGTGEIGEGTRNAVNVVTLLVAIGGVSWLTMARVIRGQVLSLKNQPFMEAARAMGVPLRRQFMVHLLPNLLGPIVVYATLTVPQAILQESFLSFLGIGVKPPMPSWGNLAAEGLLELNRYKSHWWLLFFPCLLLGLTLLALNFVGEGLREAFDPKRARR